MYISQARYCLPLVALSDRLYTFQELSLFPRSMIIVFHSDHLSNRDCACCLLGNYDIVLNNLLFTVDYEPDNGFDVPRR